VGEEAEGITVTTREDETDRALDHIQQVRTFLDFHFPGATRREFTTGGARVFRLQAAAPPDAELVVSDHILEDAGAVPYLDHEMADALKHGARIVLTHNRRRIRA
jgi:hypothetical protein